MNSSKSANIYILDDHQLIRDGLAAMISQTEKFTVAGSGDNINDALRFLADQKIDIVIVDITLKNESGLDFIAHAMKLYPRLRCLALSMHEESVYAERAIKSGAMGYVMKQEASNTILVALETVCSGNMYLSEQMKEKLLFRVLGKNDLQADCNPEQVLSNREFEVFRLIGNGLASKEIARAMGISAKTVDAHKEHIRAKLDIDSSSRLVSEAVRWKIEHEENHSSE